MGWKIPRNQKICRKNYKWYFFVKKLCSQGCQLFIIVNFSELSTFAEFSTFAELSTFQNCQLFRIVNFFRNAGTKKFDEIHRLAREIRQLKKKTEEGKWWKVTIFWRHFLLSSWLWLVKITDLWLRPELG